MYSCAGHVQSEPHPEEGDFTVRSFCTGREAFFFSFFQGWLRGDSAWGLACPLSPVPRPSSPDGNDVGEQEQEADDLQVPAASKVLQGHHDQRHHHQCTEQDLGEAVHLQVKKANLGTKHRVQRIMVQPTLVWREEV